MKLKTKILFSVMSAVMLLILFTFVESGARITDGFLERHTKAECEIALEYSLASSNTASDAYIITESDGIWRASLGGETAEAETLGELISAIERDGAVLRFDDVCSDGGIVISENVTLEGKLTVDRGDIVANARELVIKELELFLNDGSIDLRSGKLSMLSGAVSSGTKPSVTLGYSSSARLEVLGGEISSESERGTVSAAMGYVYVSGGKISNAFDTAIISETTVELSSDAEICGFEYDVSITTPMVIDGYSGSATSPLRVLYGNTFDVGSVTAVCRAATAESCGLIKLFDCAGEEVNVEFFESLPHTDERNFIAVYLPYEIKFYNGSELYKTERILKTEAVAEPEPPKKDGYVFSGWCTDPQMEIPYTFGSAENKDMTLYAAFSLAVPNFRLNSKSFAYDGDMHYLKFDELSHPLAEDGSFSFEWFKNTQPVPYSSDSVPLSLVSDSGEYKCKIIFSYRGDFVAITTPSVTVRIEKRVVKAPRIPSCEYTGAEQYPSVSFSELYTFEPTPSVNAGSYPVTFSLTDPDNYRWETTDERTLRLTYEITKAKNEFLSSPTVGKCYAGYPLSVNARVRFGELTLLYSSDGSSFSDLLPTSPGSYLLKLTVPETENYYALESEPIAFELLEETAVGIKLDRAPLRTEYTAFEKLVLDGAEFSVTYNSGRVAAVDSSELAVRYRSGECFTVSDNCATVCFGSVSVPVSVSVRPAIYDLSTLEFDSCEVAYNGKRQTISAFCEIVGKDGIALGFSVSGGGTDVGSYPITLSFEVNSINYELPDPITRMLTVVPLSLSVEYGECVFVYDGTPKLPAASIVGAGGRVIRLSVSGAATDAGTYVATAFTDERNYSLLGAEIEFEIKKADLDFSSVVWSADELVYSGSPQRVTLTGLPPSVTLAGYTDSTFTAAGIYRATASIVYDEENYNEPPALVHEWRIVPAEYDLSGWHFLDAEYVYDGITHYPQVLGNAPVGLDGSSPTYEFSRGAAHVRDGEITVTVSFTSGSGNYNAPRSITATVRILPMTISINWSGTDFVYDGLPHLPSAVSEHCRVTVSGSATDAGVYLATAVTDNEDYVISNPELSFVIQKRYNSWISSPVVGMQFEGKTPTPYAKAYHGEVSYAYYADAELMMPISAPSSVGTYYMVAYVPESKNYLYLSGEPIEFGIVEIEPVELVAELKASELVAMRELSDADISLYLLNNDGSRTHLSVASLSIAYEKGACLSANDGEVTLSYGNFRKTLRLSVTKATYDMSGVRWDLTDAVYSGAPITPKLLGLPSGITVREYTYSAPINAGCYALSATLNYDSDNYLEPILPIATLTVKPREIPLPEIGAAVYDGTPKNISLPADAEYTSDFSGATNAGVYEIRLTPKDSLNFTVANGGILSFEIFPAPITLKVSEDGRSYSLVQGELYTDDLGEEYYRESGFVYLKISDPNYELTVIPARSVGISPFAIFIIILLVLLLVLGVTILYFRREKLVMMISGISKKKGDTADVDNRASVVSTDAAASPSEPHLDLLLAVDEAHANTLISDSLAKDLVSDSEVSVETEGKRKCIVNVDSISGAFSSGDVVDINKMKERGIIPRDARRVKVLAGGVIDKPLTVIADSFSLAAVKMIALTGGHAIRVRSGVRGKKKQ